MSQAHVHHYRAKVSWTGGAQGPTLNYKAYSREHTVAIPGKVTIRGSADEAFRGDSALHNPEDMLAIAVST